jgi:hypothetical protein
MQTDKWMIYLVVHYFKQISKTYNGCSHTVFLIHIFTGVYIFDFNPPPGGGEKI